MIYIISYLLLLIYWPLHISIFLIKSFFWYSLKYQFTFLYAKHTIKNRKWFKHHSFLSNTPAISINQLLLLLLFLLIMCICRYYYLLLIIWSLNSFNSSSGSLYISVITMNNDLWFLLVLFIINIVAVVISLHLYFLMLILQLLLLLLLFPLLIFLSD